MLMVHNGRQRPRKVHIAPGAVFITRWIPPVLAILRTSTSTTLLASLSMPTTSIALCLNRKAFRPLAESPRAGPDRFRLQAKVGKNLAHANSLELQKSECWHCGNQFKFLSCSVAGADRSLDKWQAQWSWDQRGGHPDLRIMEQTIVLLEIHCYLLCSAVSTLSCQWRSMQRTWTCECESRVKVEGPPPCKVLHVRSLQRTGTLCLCERCKS